MSDNAVLSVTSFPRIDHRMNVSQTPSDEQVEAIWTWCSEAYLHHNCRIVFPKNTDPKKTYQWRYARAIAIKFQQWNFDEATAKHFINIAVAYAKEKGVARKGLAVLHQANMLEVCYQKLQETSDSDKHYLDSLKLTRKWLAQQIGDRDPFTVLLQRPDPDAYCNLVIWHQATKLPPLYLALSRVCRDAVSRLTETCPDEANLLPSRAQLYLIRERFLSRGHQQSIAGILQNDWRKPCLIPS